MSSAELEPVCLACHDLETAEEAAARTLRLRG